jgi:hypothetical protein
MCVFVCVCVCVCVCTGSVELHKAIVTPYHLQYVEGHECMIYRDGYVQSNWSSLYVCVHRTVLYNCALPDDGPIRSETCRSLCRFKHYCDCNEVCALCYIVTI